MFPDPRRCLHRTTLPPAMEPPHVCTECPWQALVATPAEQFERSPPRGFQWFCHFEVQTLVGRPEEKRFEKIINCHQLPVTRGYKEFAVDWVNLASDSKELFWRQVAIPCSDSPKKTRADRRSSRACQLVRILSGIFRTVPSSYEARLSLKKLVVKGHVKKHPVCVFSGFSWGYAYN